MDYVITKENGNSKPGFLYGNTLDLLCEIRGVGIQEAAAPSGLYIFKVSASHAGAGYGPVTCEKDGLAHLFLKGHLFKELLYAGVFRYTRCLGSVVAAGHCCYGHYGND